ncbi:MAG: hypothetical protein GTN78_13730, partial [Gemmatimonadales bacterium]|nr:hypothetical protein [Gemmatimonadales bacterium]
MKTKSLLRIINFSLLGVILALVVVLSGSGTAHAAGSFRVLSTVCLDDQTTVDVDPLRPGHAGECDGSNAPGANVALTGTFGVGLGPDGVARNADDEPDYNFGLSVSFIPPEWGVAKGTDVPIGAIVGGLKSDATLGLLGNACRSPVKVDFTFVNASTNPADVIFPEAPGEDDRLEPLALDSNGNGIADGAEKWPAYLNDIDAFARITASDIRARMFGFNNTSIADLTVVLMMIIFEPGADLLDDEDEVIDIDPRLGPISVTVLQDPTAPASAGDAVSDFCSPLLSSSINYGLTEDNPNTAANEAGKPWRTNPPDGAYSSIAAAVPQRDADGDGIENGLDPCPFDNDSGWDPRGDEYQPGADDDEDGLPNSCDPKPFVQSRLIGAIFDEDEDFWGNRMDNCPLVPNEDNNDEDGDGIG